MAHRFTREEIEPQLAFWSEKDIEQHPIVLDNATVINDAFEVETNYVQTETKELCSAKKQGLSPEARNIENNPSVHSLWRRIGSSSVALLESRGDQVSLESLTHLFDGLLTDKVLNPAHRKITATEFAANADYLSRLTDKMTSAVKDVAPKLRDTAENDSVFALGCLDALASDYRSIENGNGICTKSKISVLSTLDHATNPEISMYKVLERQVTSGTLNPLIARRFYNDLLKNADKPFAQYFLTSFKESTRLLNATDANADLFSADIIAAWPGELRSELHAQASSLVELMYKTHEPRMESLARTGIYLEPTERNIETLIDDFMRYTTAFTTDQLAHKRSGLSKADVIALRMRTRQPHAAPKCPQENVETNNLLLRDEPRELMFLDAHANPLSVVEGETPDHVADYVKDAGGDPQLAEHIMDLLMHLQLLDLSRGSSTAGIALHGKNVRLNGGVIDVWQVRPDRLSGVGNLGPHAKKMRIFATIDHNSLGILKILDKKQVPLYKKHLGIQGSMRHAR